ncbi:thermonuclease family protein [Sphingomonas sp.]|uniref:thermonuclease family protein n=1 Tax=Sphingomonas sp. TaxID=28214 RepID=UPI003CC57A80
MASVFARAPTVPAGRAFTCTATRVWDGDGPIWCAEGERLRLHDVAARELDGSCRPGQPCPRASGVEARDRLVALLGGTRGSTEDGHVIVSGPAMPCRSFGPDRYGRTVAACTLAGRDLGEQLIAAGVALIWHYRD